MKCIVDGYLIRDESRTNVNDGLAYNQEEKFNKYNKNQYDRFDEDSTDNDEYNLYESNSNWFSNQSGRSIESQKSSEESSDTIENEENANGCSTLGRDVVNKIAALDLIIAREHQRDGNLLDVENQLSVKKSAVKITKKNFVSFQNAELRYMKKGTLMYLSLNLEKDNVYMECAFDKLEATGTFKTNLAHTKEGRFAIDMNYIVSNVSANFHKGKAAIRPASILTIKTNVIADNRQDADAIVESIDRKYRSVLERTISVEMYNSTYKGMVDRLKMEMKTSLHGADNERTTKLYDLDWTEGSLNIHMSNIGGQPWKRINQRMDSMSYTRKDNDTYKMRFDVNLREFQWVSDLTATFNGQRTQIPSVQFNMESAQIHVVVLKSVNRQECRQIETDVRIRGLRYSLNEQLSSNIRSMIELKLPRFIERSFKMYLKNSINRNICMNRINAY